MTTNHGGQRKNAGRSPEFGTKGEKKKAIYIKVPESMHAELLEVCKKSIKEHLYINY